MTITKRTKSTISNLKYKVLNAEGEADYYKRQVEQVRSMKDSTILSLQAEINSLRSAASRDASNKANEDTRFNSVLQASIQTAIATALGRRS